MGLCGHLEVVATAIYESLAAAASLRGEGGEVQLPIFKPIIELALDG